MRSDLFFIILVIVIGLGGVVYSRHDHNDSSEYLSSVKAEKSRERSSETNTKQRPSTTQRTSPADQVAKIKIPTTTLSSQVPSFDTSSYNVDVSIAQTIDNRRAINSMISENERGHESEIANKSDDTEAADSLDWDTEFASWTLSVLDASTGLTGIVDLVSPKKCLIEVITKGHGMKLLDLNSVQSVKSKGNTVIYVGAKPMRFDYLKSPADVRRASSRLASMCKSR